MKGGRYDTSTTYQVSYWIELCFKKIKWCGLHGILDTVASDLSHV